MKTRSHRWRRRIMAVVFALATWSSVAFANGPPIQGETAFVTGLNGAAVRSFVKVSHRSNDDADVTAVAIPIVVPYEVIDNRLVLGLALPLMTKRLTLRDGTTRSPRFGVGDLSVFGKLGLYQLDGPGETFRIATKLGFTFPTGETDAEDELGRLPPPLQLGTGSVNPSAMLIATKLWRRFGVNADIGYTAVPEANGIDRGDVFRYDVAASFRVTPWVYETFPDHQVNLMLELNGTIAGRTVIDGIENPSSGGHTPLVSPGIQYMYDTVIVEASVQLPVLGDKGLHGDQLAPDWATLVGFRWLMF
ncbi:transporter [Desulfobulbus sp. AH-315-M07]|nr:transporter [Desulfobulbus sp. AH-315-M07]